MKAIISDNFCLRGLAVALLLSVVVLLDGGSRAFAHGGEGDEKPQVQTTGKGSVTRSARIGDFEVLLKHSKLEPDTAMQGSLFVTKFETNEPVGGSDIIVEIESADGSVATLPVEKTETAGSYKLMIPAVPEGTYTMRVKLTTGAKVDTASFSGVKFEHPAAETSGSGTAWLITILFVLSGIFVFGLFAGLVYFVWRWADREQVSDEAITV